MESVRDMILGGLSLVVLLSFALMVRWFVRKVESVFSINGNIVEGYVERAFDKHRKRAATVANQVNKAAGPGPATLSPELLEAIKLHDEVL